MAHMEPKPLDTLQPGQRLARGVCRHLLSHDFVSIEEFSPERGKRVDVMALGPKGEVWVINANPGWPIFARMRNGKATLNGVTAISGPWMRPFHLIICLKIPV